MLNGDLYGCKVPITTFMWQWSQNDCTPLEMEAINTTQKGFLPYEGYFEQVFLQQ